MKLSKDIYIREVQGEYIGVMKSDLGLDYTRVIELNETAAYLIEASREEEVDEDKWVALLLERYDVAPDVARADVRVWIDKLKSQNILLD